MHSFHVAWRDLKPENALFDAHGYLKLSDFGFAKEFKHDDHDDVPSFESVRARRPDRPSRPSFVGGPRRRAHLHALRDPRLSGPGDRLEPRTRQVRRLLGPRHLGVPMPGPNGGERRAPRGTLPTPGGASSGEGKALLPRGGPQEELSRAARDELASRYELFYAITPFSHDSQGELFQNILQASTRVPASVLAGPRAARGRVAAGSCTRRTCGPARSTRRREVSSRAEERRPNARASGRLEAQRRGPRTGFITELLHTQPSFRLGNLAGGFTSLKTHSFFSKLDSRTFNWQVLASRDDVALPPPFAVRRPQPRTRLRNKALLR